MGLISKTFTLGCAFAGLAAASQMPEFAQQYRQRLAGAVEELRVVVSDFDRDALNAGISRDQALSGLLESSEQFPRDRGQSMQSVILRFANLEKQQNSMEIAEPVARPLFMFRSPDEKLLKGTWEIFEPAVPLNGPGALWGGFGALLMGLLARFPIALTRKITFRRNRIRVEPERENSAQAVTVPSLLDQHDAHVDSPLSAGSLADPAGTSFSPVEQPIQQVEVANRSLLDQPLLDQKIVGEISPHGRIVVRGKNRIS